MQIFLTKLSSAMSKIRKENKGWQKYCRSIRKKFPIVENSYKYEKKYKFILFY